MMLRSNRIFTIFVLAALIFSACQPIVRPEASRGQPASSSEVFAQGALRHSAQGMAFDKDGMLWVTDLIGDNISVINPATGEMVRRFGLEDGIYAPADLTIAPDGTVYWIQWDTGAVGKIDKTGAVTHIADVPAGANAIVISAEGRLFVATCNMGNSAINEVYLTGDQKPRLIRGDLGLCAFRYGDWGPDGYFYGARTDLGEIARIDVNSGEMNSVAAKLGYPADVKFDRAGRLTSADVTTGEIYRLDPATGQKNVIATLEPGIGALVFDANDHLYVSNEVNGSIVEVQANGALRQVNRGGLIAPGGLTVVGDTVYLADFLSIRGYDRQTHAQTFMLPKIYGVSTLNDPLSVAPDGENLLVTSWLYNSVQIVTPKTGAILATYSDSNTPTNAIRFQGDLIVSELGTGSVVRARGNDLAQGETLVKNLKEPIGLAATADDVWVSDSATGTVWQIIAARKTLPEPKAVAKGLAGPEGLAIGMDGSLLVVEAAAGRLSAINLATGERQVLATGLQTGSATANAPSFWILNGVAVDSSGNIYVSGDVANVIYRIPAPMANAQFDDATVAKSEPIFTQTLQASNLDDATTAKLNGIIQKAMTDYPIPGVAMCIVKNGQVVYNKGFGFADLESKRPVTPQSLLIQASVTKSLTAMAIMKLAEQGKIDLDKPVTAYLPYFTMADERYKAITVRMLLSHRAGLPDSPAIWTEPLDPKLNPLEQAVGDLSEMKLPFAPGEGWNYSSYGYSALGAIIAKVTSKSFEGYMQDAWLTPLGMTHSTFVAKDVDSTLRMTLYKSDKAGKATPTGQVCDGRDAPACNLWSSCEDMAKWAQLMLDGGELNGVRFLQPESIKAMWTPLSDTPWLDALGPQYGTPVAKYGLGWYVGEVKGHRLIGHAGATEGANTQFQLAPDDDLAVIAMGNWFDQETASSYPVSFANMDVIYQLLGVKP